MGQSDFKPRKIPDSVKTNPKDLFKQRIETRDQQLKVDKKIETTFKPSTFNNFDNNNTSNKSFDASLLFKKVCYAFHNSRAFIVTLHLQFFPQKQ